jgi:hypothetical protein
LFAPAVLRVVWGKSPYVLYILPSFREFCSPLQVTGCVQMVTGQILIDTTNNNMKYVSITNHLTQNQSQSEPITWSWQCSQLQTSWVGYQEHLRQATLSAITEWMWVDVNVPEIERQHTGTVLCATWIKWKHNVDIVFVRLCVSFSKLLLLNVNRVNLVQKVDNKILQWIILISRPVAQSWKSDRLLSYWILHSECIYVTCFSWALE